jgi:hypothetical protein
LIYEGSLNPRIQPTLLRYAAALPFPSKFAMVFLVNIFGANIGYVYFIFAVGL